MKKIYLGKIIFILSIIQGGIVLASDIKNKMGDDPYVAGKNSYAIGTKVRTIGNNSTTIGVGSISVGNKIYSIGEGNKIFGSNNLILGNRNKVYNSKKDYEKSKKKKVTIKYSLCFPDKYGNCSGQPCSQTTDEEPYQRFSETGTYKMLVEKYKSEHPSYILKLDSDPVITKNISITAKFEEINYDYMSSSFVNTSSNKYSSNSLKSDLSETNENGNVVHGNNNTIYGENNIVLGSNNFTSYNNNIILGNGVKIAKKNNAIVIGNGSKAIENAVSIGNDKITRQIKYVKAGTDDTDAVNVSQLKEYVAANSSSGGGAISYVLKDGNEQLVKAKDGKLYKPSDIKELKYENGKWKNKDGNEQQPNEAKGEIVLQPAVKKVLTNISDGKIEENSTDVITGGQLYKNYYNKAEVDKKIEGINAKSNLALVGVANAIAMSSMTQPREGLVNITGAYGTYGGEHALAVGISGNTERFSYKLGVSTNMRGNVGVGLGFGMTVVSSTKDEKMKRMEETIKELKEEVTELRKLIKK